MRISRPTLRKWCRRYQELGIAGLQEESRRPKTSPHRKVFPEHEQLMADLKKRKLGHRRIQNELIRLHDVAFSTATIHKALDRLKKPHLNRKRAFRKIVTRYSRPIPGDRGREFCATEFQQRLLDWGIKFRPIKPASPHLNGKVERSQRTDLDEFYSAVDLKASKLEDLLEEWQHYYKWDRPHGSLEGKTPIERLIELADRTLLWEEISAKFDPTKERLQEQSYRAELALRKLKRCP